MSWKTYIKADVWTHFNDRPLQLSSKSCSNLGFRTTKSEEYNGIRHSTQYTINSRKCAIK